MKISCLVIIDLRQLRSIPPHHGDPAGTGWVRDGYRRGTRGVRAGYRRGLGGVRAGVGKGSQTEI